MYIHTYSLVFDMLGFEDTGVLSFDAGYQAAEAARRERILRTSVQLIRSRGIRHLRTGISHYSALKK